MKYIFDVSISTDGDFRFPYIPSGMNYYSTSGTYSLERFYDDKESAIKDITDVCAFLKEQMTTSRDWVKEMFDKCVDSFVTRVYKAAITPNTYVHEYMSCNYDCTEFTFSVQPNFYNVDLPLTDEEFELIKKNNNLVTVGQIKDAVLDLFR